MKSFLTSLFALFFSLHAFAVVVPGVASAPAEFAFGIKGTVSASPVAAGNIGEVITGTRLRASEVSLTTGVEANITSVTLTPGIWLMSYKPVVHCNNTLTQISADLVISPATINFYGSQFYGETDGTYTAGDHSVSTIAGIVQITSSTTYTMRLFANFSVGACGGYGFISAVRVGV